VEGHPQRHENAFSPFSLYRVDLASFTMGRYNPKDAEGFINLFALPVTVRPKRQKPKAANSNCCLWGAACCAPTRQQFHRARRLGPLGFFY